MIPYHGGPITPDICAVRAWTGRHAFVPHNCAQLTIALEVTQSFAVDNGAFGKWKSGARVDWSAYYIWVADIMNNPRFDFAIMPDVIEGTEKENDMLLECWPLPRHLGVPVWHSNESTARLVRLARGYPRVAIGSSGEYDVRNVEVFLGHMRTVLRSIVDNSGQPICKLHGLRMLNPRIVADLPLASADSTNVARNIGIDARWKGRYLPPTREARVSILIERIEAQSSPSNLS